MNKISGKNAVILISVVLILATFAAYEQVRYNDFIVLDDGDYVTKNQYVQAGLTVESIKWAFTTNRSGNWHPITWLSHMLDCQLFDLNPSFHHLTNLLLHITNTLLLFLVLNAMTAALWQSAFVAAAFALHPLHIESVAWVAERKDVLSTLFWLLTMASYLRYTRRPTTGSYLLTLLLLSLGLMAKPMLVTLPFVLLLLDYWPLNRLDNLSLAEPSSRQILYRLVREKIPFFALSAISCCITFFVQRGGGAVAEIERFPIRFRFANAVLSYIRYINKTLWPKDLAIYYPYSSKGLHSAVWVLIIAALLLAISIRMVKLARVNRYLFTGWFWFLGTLIPVIGIVQVGCQSIADRYTYIPLTGLFIIAAWGFNDFLANKPQRKIIISVAAIGILSAMYAGTTVQLRHWRNSITLFEHTLAVTTDNYMAHYCLASALTEQGKHDEALKHTEASIQIRSSRAKGDSQKAGSTSSSAKEIAAYQQLESYKSQTAMEQFRLGLSYSKLGRSDEAIKAFTEAVKIKPDFVNAYANLGTTYYKLGRFTEAADAYKQVLVIKPDIAEMHNNLGNCYSSLGQPSEAIEAFQQAVRIKPDYARAYYNLATVYTSLNRHEEAITNYKKALEIEPSLASAHYNLAITYLKIGDKNSALEEYRILEKLSPAFAEKLLKYTRKPNK